MSNALSIASVTRLLMDLLNDGLINSNVGGAIGQPITVSALPPDRILGQQLPGGAEPTQVNVFLHQVTYNPGWRQSDLPTRDDRGAIVKQPLLPLNLHYLLTAFGAQELHSEILLGYAMQVLHENPIVSRAALRQALAAAPVGQILPAAYQALVAADLADQVELLKITPESLSTDEMSKIWTALQTHYRPSTAYQVSVVLIESTRRRQTALPVLTRGEPAAVTGREPGVTVQTGVVPPYPTLEKVTFLNEQVVARMGDTLRFSGHDLAATQVSARFADPRAGTMLELLPLTVTPAAVEFALPSGPGLGGTNPALATDPDNWRAGTYHVVVRTQEPARAERLSNTVAVALAPTITALSAASLAGVTTFTVTCEPRVRSTQRASLIVGRMELMAEPLAAPATGTLTFKGAGFASGTAEWVRLRVDGVDSLLVDRSTTPPSFFGAAQFIIP